MNAPFTDLATARVAERAVLEANYATSRIDLLDAIFSGSKHVNWWRAFRAGPLKYWLSYRFLGPSGHQRLWRHVHAEIADILRTNSYAATERAAELRKTLELLEHRIKTTKLDLTVQDLVTQKLNERRDKTRAPPAWVTGKQRSA